MLGCLTNKFTAEGWQLEGGRKGGCHYSGGNREIGTAIETIDWWSSIEGFEMKLTS
jgi:hypothetical protein